jgi:hypothetical protein
MSQVVLSRVTSGRINQTGASGIAAIRKPVLLLLFTLCVMLSGCDGPKTTWSAESRSPDGKMIATAETIQTSGIGTGDPGTRVYLNWTTGSQPPTIILAFTEGPAGPDGMKVGMKWLTTIHLELKYKGRRELDFEAVKCHGIDISVRDLSDVAIRKKIGG